MADLESVISCPVCLEVPEKIVLCSRGHSCCQKCVSQLKICPICRGEPTSMRNLALEEFIPRALNAKKFGLPFDMDIFCCKGCKKPIKEHIYIRDDGFNYCVLCFMPDPVRNYLAESILETIKENGTPKRVNQPLRSQLGSQSTIKCPMEDCAQEFHDLPSCKFHLTTFHSKELKDISKNQFFTLKLRDRDQTGNKFVVFQNMIFGVYYKLEKTNKRLFINPVPLLPVGSKKFKVSINHNSPMMCNSRRMANGGSLIKTDETLDTLRSAHTVSIYFFA